MFTRARANSDVFQLTMFTAPARARSSSVPGASARSMSTILGAMGCALSTRTLFSRDDEQSYGTSPIMVVDDARNAWTTVGGDSGRGRLRSFGDSSLLALALWKRNGTK